MFDQKVVDVLNRMEKISYEKSSFNKKALLIYAGL